MKLTLRKAARLRTAIETRLSSMSFRGLLTMAYGQELKLDGEVKAARTKLKKDLATAERLEAILLHLRIQIGIANEATGINHKLTNKVLLTRSLERLDALAKCHPYDADKALGKMSLVKKRAEGNVYGGTDDVEIEFLDEEMIVSAKEAAVRTRRYIVSATDEIDRINGTHEIEMLPADYDFLAVEGIV